MGSGLIYGAQSTENVSLESQYGVAFQYADKALNGGTYTGHTDTTSDPHAVTEY